MQTFHRTTATMESRREILIARAEALVGYVFLDKELLWEALQAAGSNMTFQYPEGNKRLAMIGDAVLKLALLADLRSSNMTRGENIPTHTCKVSFIPLCSSLLRRGAGSMSNIITNIGSNANLERVGRRVHLQELVNTNPSQAGQVSTVTLTATLEAILGAVYIDCSNRAELVLVVMARLGLWTRQQQ